MESRQAQPPALFVVMPSSDAGAVFPFHSEDETASALLEGQDQPPVGSVMERIARLEQVVEQILDVPVLQVKEDISERTMIVDMPLLQTLQERIAERAPIAAHFGREPFEKDGRKYFDCENSKNSIKNPPLTPIDQPGDQARRDPADPIHRQGWQYACGDATTGLSDSDGAEDRESPTDAVRRESCGCACDHAGDHAGPPGDHVCRFSADSAHH